MAAAMSRETELVSAAVKVAAAMFGGTELMI